MNPGDDPSDPLDRLLRVDLDVDPRVVVGPRDGGRRPAASVRTLLPWPARSRSGAVARAGVLVALIAVGTALAGFGLRLAADSTAGTVAVSRLEPDAPGYEAVVEPTPVLAVLHDRGGDLDAVTVLTLPDGDGAGGGVVFVPTRVLADLPVFGTSPIEAAYDLGNASIGTEAVGDVLGAGVAEFTVVDADRWRGLVAPVAPLRIDNPDEVVVGGRTRFEAGPISLDAEEVGSYLEARIPGESELARLFRHEVFWRSWLDAVARAGPGSVPGESASGIARFVPTIAGGSHTLVSIPVEEAASAEFSDEPVFVVDVAAVSELVADLIPYPRSPRPGVRPRVRVLSGAGDADQAISVAATLPPVGVEVVVVGNALHPTDTTRIVFVSEEFRPAAERLRRQLGATATELDPRSGDVADITVTLGSEHG